MNWQFLLTAKAIPLDIALSLAVLAPILAFPRSPVTPGARAFAWWLVMSATLSVVSTAVGLAGANNHDFFRLFDLLSVLLLALTAQRLLTVGVQRQAMLATAAVYIVAWAAAIKWFEVGGWFSQYTSPGESIYGAVLGALLIAEALRSDELPPFRRAEAWIGLGLLLAGTTGAIRAPIAGQVAKSNRELSITLYYIIGGFIDSALVLYIIAYRSRRVTWTR